MQPLIELKNICFSYPSGRKVLENINLEIYQGKKVGLIGSNGSGKTTLLHVIMGLLPATSGQIFLFGEEMLKEKNFAKARRRIGFVFQNADDQLFSPTVLEDVAFGPLNLGKTKEQARQIAQSTLEGLGLLALKDRVAYRLSGGEKRMVALATVLAMDPDILILDEPTTGLDDATSHRITHLLESIDKTCLIVSHEYEFLSQTTEVFYGMESGLLKYLGDSSALHTHIHIHPAGALPHKH
ncbi:MAG: ABC transporter ATP-binding protein [Desulfatibacillaceae bacterium]|nr:ABC transporter ATP-binding protein [Desulfatibacillaceae bacterium]